MRLFVALDLPDDVRQGFMELIAQLSATDADARQGAGRGKRWVRPESMHVTLKFIGHIAGEQLPEIRAALAPIRSSAPVELQYRGLAFFPNPGHPRVLWCGAQPSPNLCELAADIE